MSPLEDYLRPNEIKNRPSNLHELVENVLSDIRKHGEPDAAILERAVKYDDKEAEFSRGTSVADIILTTLQGGQFRSERAGDRVWVSTIRENGLVFPFKFDGEKRMKAWHFIYPGLMQIDPLLQLDYDNNQLFNDFTSIFNNVVIGFKNIPTKDITDPDENWTTVSATIDNITLKSIQVIEEICGVNVAQVYEALKALQKES